MIQNQYFNVKSGGVVPSGIAYQRPNLIGQNVSIIAGDCAYHYTGGTYNYTPPPNPLYMAELDFNAAEPFLTLKNPNAFGTLYRFTDIDGTQDFTNNWYVIDHLTGLGWYNYSTSLGLTWQEYMTYSLTLDTTAVGVPFADWRVSNYNEIISILRSLGDTAMTPNYFPFNINGVNQRLYNSGINFTSNYFNATNSYDFTTSNGRISIVVMTQTNRKCWFVRNHYN